MEKPISQERITIDFGKGTAKMLLNVADFVDQGHVVVYAPSLNLSAYGPTKEEAVKMLFESVIVDFFETLFSAGQQRASTELTKYGWKRHKYFRKKFSNSAFVDSAGILKNFNLPTETRINQQQLDREVNVAA